MDLFSFFGLVAFATIGKIFEIIIPETSYRVFTRDYDEVVRPLDLFSQEELDLFAERFHALCPVEDFEPLRARLEQLQSPSVPTCVTLLLDNSGSMQGSKISLTIGAAGIIGMYLDRMGIKNEILGFTTTSWKGGRSRQDWITAGRPRHPGRLCELRHIIYKTADEQLSEVRNNLAAMLINKTIDGIDRSRLLKENIDGEAVLWACERLRAQPVKRRILLVISDGAPVDDATLVSNPIGTEGTPAYNKEDSYLARHLKKVIGDINRRGDIEIDAIGVQHDVSTFYRVGDKIDALGELAPVAVNKLISILKG